MCTVEPPLTDFICREVVIPNNVRVWLWSVFSYYGIYIEHTVLESSQSPSHGCLGHQEYFLIFIQVLGLSTIMEVVLYFGVQSDNS